MEGVDYGSHGEHPEKRDRQEREPQKEALPWQGRIFDGSFFLLVSWLP